MASFKYLSNSGVAPLNEFHFEMLKKSFKGGAKLALCPKNLAKSWHDKVVLAWAGPVLQRTGRGFESLHDHLESCTSLVRRDSFGTERRLQITHLHL